MVKSQEEDRKTEEGNVEGYGYCSTHEQKCFE